MTKVKGLNLCNAICGVGRRMAKTVAPEKVSRLDREFLENGSKKLTKLFAAIFFLFLIGVGHVWGTPTVLFHETFGDNSSSARVWDDSYKVQSGVTAVYSGANYTITNFKQSKNTMGSTASGLTLSITGTDAVFEVGPLNVSSYESLAISFQYKAGSTKSTYNRDLYYKTSSSGSWSKVTVSGTKATSFNAQTASLPVAAEGISTLYLKVVCQNDKGQDIIDEFELTGTAAVATPTVTTSVSSLSEVGYSTADFSQQVKSFTVSGSNLTANVTVAAPTNYEVCKTSGGTYTSSVSFDKGSGTLAAQTVYVRLASDKAAGSYDGNVTCSSTGATTKNVAVSGLVPFTVTWKANGTTHATTYVAYATGTGTALGSLPDNPDPSDYTCTPKTFYGWYDGESYSSASVAPSVISTSTKITTDKTYNAVFADVGGSSESLIELVGFESAEGYTASTTYNSSSYYTGSTGSKWKINYGAFSTNNALVGSQSAQFRVYNAGNYGELYNSVAYGTNITKIKFRGRVTNTNLDVLVKVSSDGSSWSDNIYERSLTTTKDEYEISVAQSGIKYVRFEATGTKPSSDHYDIIIDSIALSSSSTSYSNYATTCVTCDEPESLTNGANTASSQTVSWTDSENADGGYIVAYAKDYSTDPGNAVYSASDDDHYTFINVSSGTKTTNIPCNSAGTYYWWVRSRCSTSDNSSCSDWVAGDDWTMNTIYLNTNYEWNAGGAVFAVHYWNDAVTPVTGWSKLMTEVSGCYEGIYTCVIPSGYNNINFGRFSTSQVTDPTDWTYRWNQTSDLTIPTSPAKDYFTLSSKVDANNYNGSWSNYAPYYTISFNNNAAFSTTSAPSSQCVLEGAKASSPTSPKAMGKTVSGWYKEVGCSNEWDFSTQTVSAAQTLYAAWEDVATKTIYLDCSKELSGSKEWDADNVVLFAHAYINGTSLYTDVKATSAINSCDNHVYAFEIPGNADYVTFARCAAGASSIVWDGVSANVYNQFTQTVEASKDWYKVSDWTAGSLESAAFAATSYTISFAANSGTGTMSDDEVVCDDNYTIKTNAFTRECYAFTGWMANVDVTISDATVTAGTLITAGSTIQGIKSDITLTAQWSQYSCTVTLNKNGGSGNNQTVSATCGSSMPLNTTADGNPAITVHTRAGYTLLGYWDTNEESGGIQYYAYNESTSTLSSYTEWDKETNTAQTLYARWKAKVDHFIDDMHGTTGYTGDGHSESGAGYTIPGPLSNNASGNTCETSHYIFVGWVAAAGQDEDGAIGSSSNRIFRAGETMNASNTTYYAVWAEE